MSRHTPKSPAASIAASSFGELSEKVEKAELEARLLEAKVRKLVARAKIDEFRKSDPNAEE